MVSGHCRNGDFEAAESIMTIMADSGIDVGSEAYISLLLGMARAGKSLEEIEAKIETASKANVQFGDHEIFRLVVELTRNGNKVKIMNTYFDYLFSNQSLVQQDRNSQNFLGQFRRFFL
jgi:pentatricopeptide repeat protein